MVTPSTFWSAWPADLPTAFGLAGAAAVYAVGAWRVRASVGGRAALPVWRIAAGAGTLLLLVVVFLTPVEPWAETLFSAHMAQHLILTLFVAPLLVLARPVLVGAMALPGTSRRRLWQARPWLDLARGRSATWLAVVAVLVHAVTMWVWHVPALYELGLQQPLVHVAEHATMLAGALPLWWLVLDATGRHATGASVLAVFASTLQSAMLAGLLTFAGTAIITAHGAGPAAWGLTALDDQHLAGGLMWFPGGLVYVAAGAWAFLRWLRHDELVGDQAAGTSTGTDGSERRRPMTNDVGSAARRGSSCGGPGEGSRPASSRRAGCGRPRLPRRGPTCH